jgi:hypothetical protein
LARTCLRSFVRVTRSTRIFHEYGSPHLLREYQTREATYQQLAQQGVRTNPPTLYRSSLSLVYLTRLAP